MTSTKTIRVSQGVYDTIKQDLKEHEVVDDVLRRLFGLGPRANTRRTAAQKEIFLKIRGQFVVVSLGRRRGGARYKLPPTKDALEENSALRKKVVAYAEKNGASEVGIGRIERFFRRHGYFLRKAKRCTAT